MIDYKPNSHKYKEEQKTKDKKIEKVVTGVAKAKKKGELQKFADIFIAGDISNVKSYIIDDVLIPIAKKAIDDIVNNGLKILLYGSDEGFRRTKNSCTRASYRDYYDDDSRHKSANLSTKRFDYDDVLFETRSDAAKVLTQMDEIIEQYEVVSVADMYDLAGLSQPYTSNKYGWSDIRSAEVVRAHDGYIIKLPRALPID